MEINIREEFDKYLTSECGIEEYKFSKSYGDRFGKASAFYRGFTAGRSTADAEIEELKETIANTAQYQAGFRSGRNTLEAQNKRLIEALEKLKPIYDSFYAFSTKEELFEGMEKIRDIHEQALKEQ
jgi:hypothetical protein